jgi:hypothetical protein
VDFLRASTSSSLDASAAVLQGFLAARDALPAALAGVL